MEGNFIYIYIREFYIYKGKIGRVTRSRNRVDKIHARSIKYLNYGEESACNQLCIPAIPPT